MDTAAGTCWETDMLSLLHQPAQWLQHLMRRECISYPTVRHRNICDYSTNSCMTITARQTDVKNNVFKIELTSYKST